MHKIPVIRLYFPLGALHVSDYVSPSSGAIFYKLYITFGIRQTYGIGIYQMPCLTYKRLLLKMD